MIPIDRTFLITHPRAPERLRNKEVRVIVTDKGMQTWLPLDGKPTEEEEEFIGKLADQIAKALNAELGAEVFLPHLQGTYIPRHERN